jgi:hypothetical protein
MGRGLSADSKDLIRRIRRVFEAEHPNSPRRVAYALFGNRAGAMAGKISELCGRMLEAGELPLDWYDDSKRTEVKPYVVDDIDSFVAMKQGTPSFNPWQSQPVRVKVWSEKSIAGTLDPVLHAYAVPFLNTSGWNSRKMMMLEAQRTHDDPRPLIILYTGDHDPAGLRMSEMDLPRRFQKYGAHSVEIRRVAITPRDFEVMRQGGLVDPIKSETDTNCAWYVQHTGYHVGVELETLPAPELRARVEHAILDCIGDPVAWERSRAASEAVRESWQAYVDAWPRPGISIQGQDPGYDPRSDGAA